MDSTIRQVQLKCLEILDIVDKICRDHQIQYSLCGGTVVGAHLYKKCLPWDDDIDLMMTRENYNRFIELAPKVLPEGFSVLNYQQGNYFEKGITKIVNDNTTYVENNGLTLGIFLDITVYDKVPTNCLRRIDMFMVNRSFTIMRGKIMQGGFKNKIRNLILDTLLSDKKAFFTFFQKVAERLGRTKSYTYSELFGAWAQTISYRPTVFENYTEIEFEGRQYMIVRDYVEYLQVRYNRTDFREPKEKQVAPHIEFVDFSLPYKEYLRQKSDKGE